MIHMCNELSSNMYYSVVTVNNPLTQRTSTVAKRFEDMLAFRAHVLNAHTYLPTCLCATMQSLAFQ
jgi:hypothetical protein